MSPYPAWTDLEGRARTILDQARVALEGPSGNWEGGARGVPDSRAPSGSGAPTLDRIAQALQDAGSGEELLRAIQWAEVQLWRIRYARRTPGRFDTPERLRTRVLREWIGSAPEEVAEFEAVTVAQCCRWRVEGGQDPTSGRVPDGPPAVSWQTVEERALRVQQLRAAHPHLSSRALGMMVGVSHPTVLADLHRGP